MSHCKHLRTHSALEKNGYTFGCLACGYRWFKKKPPMTEEDKADQARYEHNLELEKRRK